MPVVGDVLDTGIPGVRFVSQVFDSGTYASVRDSIARVATFAPYSAEVGPQGLIKRFDLPRPGGRYALVHQRTRGPLPLLEKLSAMFATPESLQAMRDVSGATVSCLAKCGDLTCWGPGSFATPHTDAEGADPFKLVMIVSLSQDWDTIWGGSTRYWHKDTHEVLTVAPTGNTAILLTPSTDCFHWVEQVSADAPPLRRMSWVMGFS